MIGFDYILYLQKSNGYWEKEPYQTLEEIQPVIDSLDEEEYWWYIVVHKSQTKGDEAICGGRVHTKIKNKTRNRKGR